MPDFIAVCPVATRYKTRFEIEIKLKAPDKH
jgi:hypothetical protein